MTQIKDPYPDELADVDAKVFTAVPGSVNMRDPQVDALNRIATALEQIALNQLDRPQPAQRPTTGPTGLAPLPAVQVAQPVPGGVCPIHNVPWKVVPAGVSKKTGKPYDAFQACSVAGCDQRPPR